MADGALAGSVINIANNEPIANAQITAQPEGGGTQQEAKSNDQGEWGPISVPAGIYDMTVAASGFDEGIYPGIVVLENVTTQLPFALHPSDWQ